MVERIVVMSPGIRSLKMSNDKKRKFGLVDLRYGFMNWRGIFLIVALVVIEFVSRHREVGPFDTKGFIDYSVTTTVCLLVYFTLISYARYRAEIKKEEDKKPK